MQQSSNIIPVFLINYHYTTMAFANIYLNIKEIRIKRRNRYRYIYVREKGKQTKHFCSLIDFIITQQWPSPTVE